MDSTIHYTSVSHSGSLMATINKMRVNSDLCDVTLVVGEYRIMAHRIILSASAPFFYQMLQLHSQPHQESNNEVQLNNIDEIAALKIIEFCYTSAISLDDDTVWPLLAASIKFQLPEICSFCCEFLVAGLDTTNCILSLRLAAKVHCPQLEENCVRYLLENIDQACISQGLTSLATPELYSLLSVLALHDVDPATMAKLATVWMDVDRAIRQDGVFSQLLDVFPSIAPYLNHFGSTKETDLRIKGDFDTNRDGKSSSKGGYSTTGFGKPTASLGTDYNREVKGRVTGNIEEEEAVVLSKSASGFGVGASREFICISCGDDFDCQEDLVSHQNECGESARMVGSASGDSLREGLMGRGKSMGDGKGDGIVKGGDMDELADEKIDGDGERRCDKDSRKRKIGDDEMESFSSDGKASKLIIPSLGESLENKEMVTVGGNNVCERVSKGDKCNDTGMSKPLNNLENETSLIEKEESPVENLSSLVRSNSTELYEPDRNAEDNDDGDGTICTNDDNNNAIGRGDNRFQKDDIPGQKTGDFISQLDVVSTINSESRGKFENHSSSFPDILSTSSGINSTESHFKTRKSSDLHGWQSKNRYASSSAGFSSAVIVSSSSSSSSLQHLRPQQRCQICGKSFWERKQLCQHWVLDHGINTAKINKGDNMDDEQDLLSSSNILSSYHQSKLTQSLSRLSPGKDIHPSAMGVASNSWPYPSNLLGQGTFGESMIKSGSAFRATQKADGETDMIRLVRRDSADPVKIPGDLEIKAPFGGDFLTQDEKEVISTNRKRQLDLDRLLNNKFTLNQNFKPHNVIDTARDRVQDSSTSPESLIKQERLSKTEVSSGNDDTDWKTQSFFASGSFVPPGTQGLASSDFLSSYLNQCNKFAQWCLAQGPNFCPTCLVYHTNGSPCPRPQTSLSKEKVQSYSARNGSENSADKKETIKEDVEEEEKEVNVDRVDEEMEEGPLDMSKSSMEFSSSNNLSSLSSSSISTSSAQFMTQPMNHPLHNRPPSSASSSVLGFPPYYNYSHFLSGSPMMDMSAATLAAMKAAAGGSGSFADLIPRQSPVQELPSAVPSGTGGRDPTIHLQNYNSYLHHHSLSASAIAAQSSLANNNSNKNNNGTAVFSSVAAARTQNALNGGVGLASSHDISSASSPSSIFSFPSSPPNTNASSTPTSSLTSHLPPHPPPSTSSGKKKSTTGQPKQGFPCTVCNRVYSHQSALFAHMRSHSPSARSYPCQFCNETFARAPDLKVHVCPNGIEKPFTCPSCGQTFAKNIHLKRHLATHSGLKPYPCWVCGKRFSRSDHLKRHTQSIHAGARPHACHICGKEFVRKYELNKHMTLHTVEST